MKNETAGQVCTKADTKVEAGAGANRRLLFQHFLINFLEKAVLRVLGSGIPHAGRRSGRAIPQTPVCSAARFYLRPARVPRGTAPAGLRACVNVSGKGTRSCEAPLTLPASGGGRGPRGGDGGSFSQPMAGGAGLPEPGAPRTPPLGAASAPPPPGRPSARLLTPARRPGTHAGVRPAPQPRQPGREKGPDGWAETAPPQSAELVLAKL